MGPLGERRIVVFANSNRKKQVSIPSVPPLFRPDPLLSLLSRLPRLAVGPERRHPPTDTTSCKASTDSRARPPTLPPHGLGPSSRRSNDLISRVGNFAVHLNCHPSMLNLATCFDARHERHEAGCSGATRERPNGPNALGIAGPGIVFELTPAAKLTVLLDFCGPPGCREILRTS
jgi:hypothetical protein